MPLEVFGNVANTTVTSGGGTTPVSGTQETWVVSSLGSFPLVSDTANPATQLHITDIAANSETIEVLNMSGSGNLTWLVERGAEGTTPVSHTDPFTVYEVVSAGAYEQLKVTDWLNAVSVFGADPTAANFSDTAFADMVAAYQATGQPGFIPAGTYKVSAAMNWKVAGLAVFTDGAANVTITQETANTPILQLAGKGQHIGGLTLTYASQQSSSQTSAIGVEFGDNTVGSCFMSTFEDFSVQLAATAMAISPAVSTVAGLFSCYFGNIEIDGFSIQAAYWYGSNGGGANCTGCVIDNLYIHNNYTGSDAGSTSWPLELNGWDEIVINQLNIEHAEVFDSDACLFTHCGNIIINSFHVEHLEMSGNPGYGLVGVGTGTVMVQVNGLSVRFMTFSGTSYNSVFRVTGGSGQNILLNGLKFPSGDGGDSTSAIALVDFNSTTGVSAQLTGLDSTETQLWTETYANAGAGCSGVITDGTQVTYFPPLGWTTFATGNAGNNLNSTSGGASVPVAGEWYYSELYVPFTFTATGLIAAPPSGTTGTTKWNGAIWNSSGTLMTSSATAGTTTPGSLENFRIPFSAATALAGPATYLAGIQANATTPTFESFANNTEGFVTGEQAGTFGIIPAIGTPATTYTANLGPMLKTY